MLRDTTLSLIWLIDEPPRDTAPASLRAMRDGLRTVAERCEIVLVTRNAAAARERFIGADPLVRGVVPGRGGAGASLTAGCAAATGDYLMFALGGDVPDWDALRALAPYVRHSDVTLASAAGMPSRHGVSSPAALAFLYGVSVRDPFAAAQIFRAELLRGVTFSARGPLLRVEVLAKARAQGGTVTVVESRKSKVKSQSGNGVNIVDHSPLPAFDFRLSTFDYFMLWARLRGYRTRWSVRERSPVARPLSEYVAGGVALAAGVWAVRRLLARRRRGLGGR